MKSSPRRVLMLLENNPYPHDTRVRHESTALIRAGYRVSVICPAAERQAFRENIDSVQVYRYPAPPDSNGFLAYIWEYFYSMLAMFLLSLIVWGREGFDIIHTANPPDLHVFVAAVYKCLGKRFVYDHHDLAPEMYRARCSGHGSRVVYQALLWLERLSCRLADHVIATNESYKRIERQRGGVPENRITVVRNGPDLKAVLPEIECGVRQQGEVIIGYAGLIGPQDGLEYLIRSLYDLLYCFGRTDFRCFVVGDGPALPAVKAMVAEFDLGKHVSFAGWISDPEVFRHYLSSFDICAAPEPSNPYNDCSTMIKVVDYMAMAKPIVAFDLPEHRFSARDAAVYAAKDNCPHEFARAIAELMDDPVRRKRMGSIGRKRVETELAWCYSVPPLLDAYHALCTDSRRKSHIAAPAAPPKARRELA